MPTQQQIDHQKELKGTYPNLQPEFRAMTTWDEFISHPAVGKNHALWSHVIHLFKMGVPFRSFKKVLNNVESFEKLMTMKPRAYKTNT